MIEDRLGCFADVWNISYDTSEQMTVLGTKRFTNIIATLRGSRTDAQHLVLSAHYDSKLFKSFEFLGACDSAVPCIILLRLAEQIAEVVRRRTAASSQPLPQITIVFFDGEEAFVEWTDTDSLYGSHHLAARWEAEGKIKSITLFLLMDLLGTADSVPQGVLHAPHRVRTTLLLRLISTIFFFLTRRI